MPPTKKAAGARKRAPKKAPKKRARTITEKKVIEVLEEVVPRLVQAGMEEPRMAIGMLDERLSVVEARLGDLVGEPFTKTAEPELRLRELDEGHEIRIRRGPPEYDMPFAESVLQDIVEQLRGLNAEAHDVGLRLENLGDRVFGPTSKPEPGTDGAGQVRLEGAPLSEIASLLTAIRDMLAYQRNGLMKLEQL